MSDEMKLAQALHEASVYGIGATSDVNQRVILEAAKAFAAAASAEPTRDELKQICWDLSSENMTSDAAERQADRISGAIFSRLQARAASAGPVAWQFLTIVDDVEQWAECVRPTPDEIRLNPGRFRSLYTHPAPDAEIVAAPELTCEFTKALPGGVLDDSTFSEIETALDRADAPSTEGERWLTLPERIAALAKDKGEAPAVTQDEDIAGAFIRYRVEGGHNE